MFANCLAVQPDLRIACYTIFNAATFRNLMNSPGALSVICSSQCMSLCCLLEVHNALSYYPSLWDVATGRLHAQPIAAIMLTNCIHCSCIRMQYC